MPPAKDWICVCSFVNISDCTSLQVVFILIRGRIPAENFCACLIDLLLIHSAVSCKILVLLNELEGKMMCHPLNNWCFVFVGQLLCQDHLSVCWLEYLGHRGLFSVVLKELQWQGRRNCYVFICQQDFSSFVSRNALLNFNYFFLRGRFCFLWMFCINFINSRIVIFFPPIST